MSAPDGLACVVLSLRCEPGLVGAVRSLLEQAPAELVVVNSGGGDAAGVLRAAGLDVPVVEREERLYPGAVRNLGIAATSARWIAFLAADCRAEPGWVEGRLREHRAGAEAVASSVTNPSPRSAMATAAHLLVHGTRTPQSTLFPWALHGLSYDRGLFERHGLFREDLRIGEDTELNERLEGIEVVWARDVRTAHPNPTTLSGFVRDLEARARLRGRHFGAARTKTRRRLLRELAWGTAYSARLMLDTNNHPHPRPRLLALLALAAVVRCGALLRGYAEAGRRRRGTGRRRSPDSSVR